MRIQSLHISAMQLAKEASIKLEENNTSDYHILISEAYALEKEAAQLLKNEIEAEPTRSVLYRSAATLANKCGKNDEAIELINEAFSGKPPKEIENELKQLHLKILKANNSEKNIYKLPWLAYFSAAASLIISFLIWQPNKLSDDKLFSKYALEDTNNIIVNYNTLVAKTNPEDVRGSEHLFHNYTKLESEKIFEAIALFKNGNFEKTKSILSSLEPRKKNDKVLLFLALSQLKTSDVKLAASNLEYLNYNLKFEFKEDVQFHLALCYIKLNHREKAKTLLLDLASNKKSIYAKLSQEILDDMRWF